MDSVRDEDAAEREAEQRDLEDGWKQLVRSVLSNVHIDPKYKGQVTQYFKDFEGEITPEQVKALKGSRYGEAFCHVMGLWSELPKKGRTSIDQVVEWFRNIAIVTGSPFRSITKTDADREKLPQLTDVQILGRVSFLSAARWANDTSWFNREGVAEQLNGYIASRIDWHHINRTLLQMCVHYEAAKERAKLKKPSESIAEAIAKKSTALGVTAALMMHIISIFFPIAFWLLVDGGILYWSAHHYEGENASIWALVGFLWIAVTVPMMIIHYGTFELRRSLRKISEPGWDYSSPTIHPDLEALDKFINGYMTDHVNLRLVRTQVTRLQGTSIKIPVQFLTLIDRSIAKGHQHW